MIPERIVFISRGITVFIIFLLSPKHSSSRGSFIAYQSRIRHEFASADFSAAVHRTVFHKFRTRSWQKFISTHDEAAAFETLSIYLWLLYQFLQQCELFTQTLSFSPPYITITRINPLNTELNPICHLLSLLGAHHILHISRIRFKSHLPSAGIIRSSPYSPR